LAMANRRFREDRDLVLEAVRRNGLALEFVASRYKADREVVLAAVASQEWALEHASQGMLADREVILTALKKQSEFVDFDENVFGFASENLRGDRELVLWAVHTSVLGLGYASADLKRDKDFVLQVFRIIEPEEFKKCYFEIAADTVREAASFESFRGAADTVLACRGQQAPVLTVSVRKGQNQEGRSLGLCCTVTLISGASFECHLPFLPKPPPPPPPPSLLKTGSSKDDENTKSEPSEPPKKRQRLGQSDGDGDGDGSQAAPAKEVQTASSNADTETAFMPVTMGYLAEFVWIKLLERRQMKPPPRRIFLLLTKGSDGENDDMHVTPWEWDRPITDFFQSL